MLKNEYPYLLPKNIISKNEFPAVEDNVTIFIWIDGYSSANALKRDKHLVTRENIARYSDCEDSWLTISECFPSLMWRAYANGICNILQLDCTLSIWSWKRSSSVVLKLWYYLHHWVYIDIIIYCVLISNPQKLKVDEGGTWNKENKDGNKERKKERPRWNESTESFSGWGTCTWVPEYEWRKSVCCSDSVSLSDTVKGENLYY